MAKATFTARWVTALQAPEAGQVDYFDRKPPSLGIPRFVVAKILNHVEPDVTKVYDRHSYDAEKRQALEAWGRKVLALVTGETGQVIPLRRKDGE
jgi:hypothetical protein